ncbi:MAG: anti-sigma F factor [Clostridia bacterium]|nr:anti-sigma F factor [Clostridia bacterium]
MKNNYIYTQFKACAENEKLARQIIAHFVSDLNPTLDELCDIKTAVSEAVTNAVIHGYKNKAGIIFMSAEICKNEIIVEISDKGYGISDVEAARQPLFTTQPEMERSGMGFTVMETFMDDLQVYSKPDCGTKIIMRKKIANND